MAIDSGLTGVTFTRPSLVKPQFADECDLSKIVSRFIRSGELPNLAVRRPLSVQDIISIDTDFGTIQLQRVKVIQAFEQLPLETREKFLHDPERWLDSLTAGNSPAENPQAENPPAENPSAENPPAE